MGPRVRGDDGKALPRNPPTYAEIGVTTNFSFLRGASHPQDYVHQAAEHGLVAIGIADHNTLAGVVRAYSELNNPDLKVRPKLLIGSRLVFTDGTPDLLVYPRDREAYGRLCQLLSKGKLRAEKGECHLAFDDLAEFASGQLMVLMPSYRLDAKLLAETLRKLNQLRSDGVWLGASFAYRGDDLRRLARLQEIADAAHVPLLATNDVLYHAPERRTLQDVLTCIREKTTIEKAGRKLESNAERHLKPPQDMARLFENYPDALAETLRFADQISFSLDDLKYQYPDEPVPPGKTAQQHLEDLTWAGYAGKIAPDFDNDKLRATVTKELALIAKLKYAHYFLTVHDIVRYARSQNILCQGRGSAANSAVCFMLGVTSVNPVEIDLLFERFLSEERLEPPDIDVDFEHNRREEVLQYVYRRYGRHRAAIIATVIHYRPRSAIRDVGKALGLTEDVTAALADTVWGSWGEGFDDQHLKQSGLDAANPMVAQAVALATELIGFPRHLSQHVGGYVLTQDRLDSYVPIGNAAMEHRTFIEWDKDDVDEVRMMKVDVLALGMLTCIRKCFDLLAQHKNLHYELATIPREDKDVYAMLQRGESLGVFQVESRAQMNMLPRLKPANFYDLVIEVAIVRPGPIQGNMVHPYLKRRAMREEDILYPGPHPDKGPPDELRAILKKTRGVPLFQEQAMRIAIEAAKFTPDEANQLRKAMATFRHNGTIHKFEDKMVQQLIARGYPEEFARNCFNQIKGFGEYGFPESHAASFALLVYVSSWLKHHHPDVFCCALLNSQPMGFYAPAQIVADARKNGVEVRAIDVSHSFADNTIEEQSGDHHAMRLGFRQIDGFGYVDPDEYVDPEEPPKPKDDLGKRIVEARAHQPFTSLEDFARATALPKRSLSLLADADAFRSLKLDRRAALWAVRRLPDDVPLPLFTAAAARELMDEQARPLPEMALAEHVVTDYQTIRLSIKGHPMQFLREKFAGEGVRTCHQISYDTANNRFARCAGVVLVRQRPGTAKGVVFMTIEDETGIANIVVWPKVMARFRKEVMGSRLILIEGKVQKSEENVVHLVAERMVDRSFELAGLSDNLSAQRALPAMPALIEPLNGDRRDVPEAPAQRHRHPRDVRILPASRDFH
jgi:error-prone DNA polymerase